MGILLSFTAGYNAPRTIEAKAVEKRLKNQAFPYLLFFETFFLRKGGKEVAINPVLCFFGNGCLFC